MPMRRILLLINLLLFIQGCAVSDGLLHFHDSGEVLEIRVDTHLRSKLSYIEASGADGLFCSGSSYTLHRREPWLFGCSGDEGKLVLACNDGRHLVGRWSAESCSEGQGVGGDQFGNTFVLAYGELREDVQRKVGTGPERKQPSFADIGPSSPLYSSLLGYDAEGGLAVLAQPEPRRASSGPAGPSRGSAGFFSSSDGRIITSAEGLARSDSVAVYLPGEGRELPARILSINPADDIAVLKIEAGGNIGAAVRVLVIKGRSNGSAP